MSLYRKQREKGAMMILLLTMIPLFLIPIVGLAIDGTMCYLVQAKLAGAVDGAALGAGRLLGTPANTNEIAGEFLNVNFPTGWWRTRNLQPNITSSLNAGIDTINVSATVDVPLLFMRIFGLDHSTVAASATATRSDARVELVLDRSGSMTIAGSDGVVAFPVMIAGVENFVGMFTPGRDELGMVAFGGSAIVGYPTGRPYNTSPTSAGGPDTGFATNSTTGPLFTQLNAMNGGGGTGMAEGLSLAFIELQKAHNRDFTANGADNRQNSIVLFTDGVPTTLAVQPNYNAGLSATVVSSSSSCTYKATQTSGSTHIMQGWVGVPGSNASNWGTPLGLYDLATYDTSKTLTQWLGYMSPYDQITTNPSGALAGCSGLNNPGASGSPDNLNELSAVPTYDVYGNSTSSTDNGYQNSTQVYNGTAYDPTKPTHGYHLAIGIWNAVDNVGKTIRAQTVMGTPITIYTIGYEGNGGTDDVLLKRLANESDSTSFVASQPQGQFYPVTASNQLGAVFAKVGSNILRLAK
ncbi:MAG TPA: pilus assembly protein TadG-related protein [Bryobacteraceae bacterium]|nr:pilus assembly protein TadG-related protein [Bryobacteraceae bacterium]